MPRPTKHPKIKELAPEVVELAQGGDAESLALVWEAVIPIARRVARSAAARYTWLDADDLQQDLLLGVPRFLSRFRARNEHGHSFEKYVFFRLSFYIKDVLRREDPLGISYPQKLPYPQWSRLGDESLEGYDAPDERSPGSEEVEHEPTIGEALQTVAPDLFNRRDGLVGPLRRSKCRPKKIKTKKLRARPTHSLKFFLKEKNKKMNEQPQEPTPAQPVTQPAPPKKKTVRKKAATKDGWPKARRESHARRVRSKKKAKAKTAEVSAGQLLRMATAFADAAGGIKQAVALLEQIQSVRK